MNASLKVEKISLSFYSDRIEIPVLDQYSLAIARGETVCILGASGCGKSSLLRAIAGFEQISRGAIFLNDRLLSSPKEWVAPEHRRIGFMFQDYALFPHMSVEKNIGFGLHKLSSKTRDSRVRSMLELIGMDTHAKRLPHELSGGQQQRVALARALAPGPEILLLDEPFSNLDHAVRHQIMTGVRDIIKNTRMTTLVVTHSQDEALALGDRVECLQSALAKT